MVKILLKALILILIVVSIYLIVHPAACFNMMTGRQRQDAARPAPASKSDREYEELFSPSSSGGKTAEPSAEGSGDLGDNQAGVFDTNSMKEPFTYTQEDFDYAVASRYVELEREYAKNNTLGKDATREISHIVMDDFELTPRDWESFLSRATSTNLFNRVRAEQEASGLK